jgi:hypothetical protein
MFKVFASSLLVLAFSSLAHAQQEGPCAADAAKLCPGIAAGDGRIAKCLHENKDKVSAECKATKEKMKAAFKEVKEACHDDVEKFCGSVQAGKGRIIKCMKEHKEEVSEGCRAEIEQMKERRKGRKGN